MKKLFAMVMASAVCFSAPAKTESFSPYVSLKGVITDTTATLGEDDDDYKNIGVNFAVGTNVDTNIRVEFEIAQRNKDTNHYPYDGYTGSVYVEGQDNISLRTTSYMLNGYYDFYSQSVFTPYIGLGLGMAKVEYENAWSESGYNPSSGAYMGTINGKDKYSKTKMVWNIALGASYKVNEKLNLDLGYRYVDYGSFTDSDIKFETKSNEFSLGVRYAF